MERKKKYEEIRQHVEDVLEFHEVKDFVIILGDEKFCVSMGCYKDDSFLELYKQVIDSSIPVIQAMYRQMNE